MEFKEMNVTLKNGKNCLIRSPKQKDAKELLYHIIKTCDETNYLSRYGEEITFTVEQEEDFLKNILESSKDMMICVEMDGKVIANAGFGPVSSFMRNKHRATFGISIQKAYWNMGIGSILIPAIIDSAKKAGYELLELEVIAENKRACHLYEKYGFQTYGTRRNAFKYKDGTYADEYLMMLELMDSPK